MNLIEIHESWQCHDDRKMEIHRNVTSDLTNDSIHLTFKWEEMP